MEEEDKPHPNWRALASVSFHRKVFIKATSESDEKKLKAKQELELQKRQLDGSEAKTFYENVLQEPSTSFQRPKKAKIVFNIKKKDVKKYINYSDNDLFKAAQNDNIDFIKQVLQEKPELKDLKDSFGWSLLMISCKAGSQQVVKHLIDLKADISVEDKSGSNCFTVALNDTIKTLLTQKDCKTKKKAFKEFEPKEKNCDLCNVQGLTKSELKAHLSSTVHLFKQEGHNPDPKVHYVIPEANKGFQMMLNSGWESNKGLGPPGKSGKLFPVKTSLKRDRHGLGLEEKPVKKVTHFESFDEASVSNKKRERVERNSTVSKKKRMNKEARVRQKEVDFRREFL